MAEGAGNCWSTGFGTKDTVKYIFNNILINQNRMQHYRVQITTQISSILKRFSLKVVIFLVPFTRLQLFLSLISFYLRDSQMHFISSSQSRETAALFFFSPESVPRWFLTVQSWQKVISLRYRLQTHQPLWLKKREGDRRVGKWNKADNSISAQTWHNDGLLIYKLAVTWKSAPPRLLLNSIQWKGLEVRSGTYVVWRRQRVLVFERQAGELGGVVGWSVAIIGVVV